MKLSKQSVKIYTFLNALALVIVVFFALNQRDLNSPTVFIDTSCEFCEQLMSEISFREFDKKTDVRIKSLQGNSLNKNNYKKANENCDIPEDQRAVPLLYIDGKCFIGVIEILKELERISVESQ